MPFEALAASAAGRWMSLLEYSIYHSPFPNIIFHCINLPSPFVVLLSFNLYPALSDTPPLGLQFSVSYVSCTTHRPLDAHPGLNLGDRWRMYRHMMDEGFRDVHWVM